MSTGFGDILAPGVHAMPTDQVTPTGLVGILRKILLDLRYQHGDVLCVVENRNPDARLVGRDAFETFEHFKVADADSSYGGEML